MKDNSDLLKCYTNELLLRKWPSQDNNERLLTGAKFLSFMFTWEPFLDLFKLAMNSSKDTVLYEIWNDCYIKSFEYLAQTIGLVVNANEQLHVIKLLRKHEKVLGMFTS